MMKSPKPYQGSQRRSIYPFHEMQIGDSVFFPNEPEGLRSNPAHAVRNMRNRRGRQFYAEKEGNGVRIWRTA